jgi:hypothetical protein
MLADASISWVRISKAKPQRGPAGHRGTRTPASSHTGGGKRRRRRDIPDAGTKWSSGTVTLHRHSWRRAGAGWGGESGRGATSGRGAASGRCTSVRGGCRCGQARRWWETTMHASRWGADVGAAKLAGGGRRRCARVGEGRHVGEERRVGEGRRIGEEPFVGDGATRRGGGDDDRGREARRRFGGKWLSVDLKGDRAYIEPQPFVTGHIHNRDKRPFSLGSYYDPRLKAALLSRMASRPVTKGAFRAGSPKGEFSPFVIFDQQLVQTFLWASKFTCSPKVFRVLV